MNSLLRRAAGLIAAPALALSAVAVTAPAADAADPAPAGSGASWLVKQLTDGLVMGAYEDGGQTLGYTDHGLSADILLALDAIGGQDAAVATIADALATDVETWHSSFAAPVDAGAVAKSLLVAQAAGLDVTDFGGVDLVTKLEARIVDTAGPTQGRLVNDGSTYGGDFRSAISQALAVQALDALPEPSDKLGAATSFLLEQQCAAGFFRQRLATVDAADQTCEGGGDLAVPDPDATAIAIVALQSQLDVPAVAATVGRAVTWLAAQQQPNGSFGGGAQTEAPNANSTGLAASALAASGRPAAAALAATWIRGHQLQNVGTCAPYGAADVGAVASNDAGLAAAAAADIEVLTADPYRRASAQAIPALQYAPAATGPLTLTGPQDFVRAGSTQTLTTSGVAPGATACLTGTGLTSSLVGAPTASTAQVSLPVTTGESTYTLTTAAGTAQTTISALAGAKLKVKLARAKVATGTKVKVTVSGLVKGESVRLLLRGGVVKKGQASARGVFTAKIKVSGKRGKAKVKVFGEFDDRRGSKSITVIR